MMHITFDQIAFENHFVESAPSLTSQQPLPDGEVVDFLVALVHDAKVLAGIDVNDGGDQKLGDWKKSFFQN